MKNINDIIPPAEENNQAMGSISIDLKDFSAKPDVNDLLILPTRNLVMFPGVHLTIGLGRRMSIDVAEFSEAHHTPIGIVCQIDPDIEHPTLSDLHSHGVVADVLKVLELPDGSKTALVRGRGRFAIAGPGTGNTAPDALSAHVSLLKDSPERSNSREYKAVIENIRNLAQDVSKKSPEMQQIVSFPNGTPDDEIVNVTATNLPVKQSAKFQMIQADSIKERALILMNALKESDEMLDIQREVMEKARAGMEQNQRSAFLQMQMDTIREELYGDETTDADNFRLRADEIGFDEEKKAIITKEIDKLQRYNPQSPDYAIQYSYLDTVLSLPWAEASELNNDFQKAESVLESDHYGLEKVKERIIEQLAVIMDNPDVKAPILCLVGPPGVGKTSLGVSIAKALGREYRRVALGGVHDEAEIRGHRRTYLGSMPGRIIDALKRAGTNNPVLLLDEIDKLGTDIKGDPASALLEVLDPEQNCHFHDNYIDIDFDLSNVLFIATANSLQTVPRPLLDRIEVIEIPGYVPQEKLQIARRHLIPRILKEQGWQKKDLKVSDEAIMAIIDDYTAESGVRQLEKLLGKILRKAVLAKLRNNKFPSPVRVKHLKELLGTPPYHRERAIDTSIPGVVTGLAWTQVGGEILLVEVSLSPAKTEGKLIVTGNLGDVMKESAAIALQWIKAHATELGIDNDIFDKFNIHVHFPEGAVPKDGPSAGITIVTALVSALTGKPVRQKLAMTGETTLRGQVLPVGGIREKLLAAKRAGITDIIVCDDNRRDVDDIPADYLQGVTMHYVHTLDNVLKVAFA